MIREVYIACSIKLTSNNTVNPEIFARILFFGIGLKDIFVTLKNHDWNMIYLYQ